MQFLEALPPPSIFLAWLAIAIVASTITFALVFVVAVFFARPRVAVVIAAAGTAAGGLGFGVGLSLVIGSVWLWDALIGAKPDHAVAALLLLLVVPVVLATACGLLAIRYVWRISHRAG